MYQNHFWGHLFRKLLIYPVYIVLWTLLCGLLPLWLLVTLFLDLLHSRRFALTRSLALAVLGMTWELLCMIWSSALWLVRHLPLGMTEERELALLFHMQHRIGKSLWEAVSFCFGLQVEVQGQDCTATGPYLLFCRHAGVVDSFLGTVFVAYPHQLNIRYILKEQLRLDPIFDLIGSRLPNAFISRDASDSDEALAKMRGLVSDLQGQQAVLIYPEGTKFTKERRERLLDKFSENDDLSLHEYASSLQHTLPPRPSGVLTLLDERPDLDVVFCAHTGLEPAAKIWDVLKGSLVGNKVSVSFWRVSSEHIPTEEQARLNWLNKEWSRIDQWVAKTKKRHNTQQPTG